MRRSTLFRTIALRTFFSIAACVAGLSTLACGGGEVATLIGPLEPAVVAKLTLSLPLLEIGQTATVTVTAQGDDSRIFEGGVVTWATSDPSIVTISSTGPRSASAVAVGIGQTTITASLGTRSVIGTVNVASPPTTGNGSAFTYTEERGMTILAVPADSRGADALAINDLGQVVGAVYPRFGRSSHAFIWSAATGMIDLGGLGAGGYATASAISQNGQVAGSEERPNGIQHAFRWTRETGMVDLGVLPFTGGSYAHGINSSGQIVGSSGSTPFRWTPDRGMERLGSTATVPFAAPYAINESGQIAGSLTISDGEDWRAGAGAILWSSSGVKSDILPCPAAVPFCGAAALAINGNGMVAGTDGTNAFVWTAAGGVRTIASLGRATGINDKGTVVGTVSGVLTRGFIWSEAGGYREILPPAGRSAVYVTGINNLGQIVGTVR